MELQNENLDDFEPIITSLYQKAFLTEISAHKIVFPSKNSYTKSCYHDYGNAQKLIANEIIGAYELKKQLEADLKRYRMESPINVKIVHQAKAQIKVIDNRILVLRRLFDSVAFKFFDGKIWIAKRFILHNIIKGIDIPAIKSNLEAANLINSKNSLDFALVTDLSTYIEVGDLILKPYGSKKVKWLIVEIKLGKVNKTLVDILNSNVSTNPDVIEGFDSNTLKQMNRMIRQKDRTNKIISLIKNGKGTDIKSDMSVTLEENKTNWQYYNTHLRETIDGAKREKVSLIILENCFSIFASTLTDKETFDFFYQIIYHEAYTSLETTSVEETKEKTERMKKILSHPYVRDLTWHNMYAKCHTPFFVLPIEDVFSDLLFKRMRILLYLDINKFVVFCQSRKFQVEQHSKKDTNFLKEKSPKIPLLDDRAMILISPNGKRMTIGVGLFNRLFFDLVTPSTLLDIMNTIMNK